MNKSQIAEVIETSPVKLTADETRMILRAAQSNKPVKQERWGGSTSVALLELGLLESVPMETQAARSGRVALAWRALKDAVGRRDAAASRKAIGEIELLERDESLDMGLVLTDLGKQVARGITVRIASKR